MNRLKPCDDARIIDEFQRRHIELIAMERRFWMRHNKVSYWLGAVGGAIAGGLLTWAFFLGGYQ